MIVPLVLDGEDVVIDTSLISGAEAISFEVTTGAPLDLALPVLMAKLEAGAYLTAVDRSVLRWLHVRQTSDPEAELEAVARMVPLFAALPEPAEVAEPEPAAVE